MRRVRNWMLDTFTLPGTIAIGLLIAGGLMFLWILWAVEQAAADEPPVRAITAAQHGRCANMPRGNQEMEDRRYGCFKELYFGRRIRFAQKTVGGD